MKKVIFIDLDGTLLNDDKVISVRNMDAIERVKNLGYEVVVCTARAIVTGGRFAEQIGSHYMLFSSGNIYDFKTQKTICADVMDSNQIIEIYNTVTYENHEDVVFIFTDINGTRFASKRESEQDEVRYKRLVIEGDVGEWILKNQIVHTFIVNGDSRILAKIRDNVISKFGNFAVTDQSGCLMDPPHFEGENPYLGFANITSGKGQGVKKFCEMFNISRENRISIGDAFNDLSMFDACGYNVAMGNALKDLKDKADFITDTNNNDGVAKVLETLK